MTYWVNYWVMTISMVLDLTRKYTKICVKLLLILSKVKKQ